MRQFVIAAIAATGVVVLAATLRGEPLPSAGGSATASSPPEPITGTPAPDTPGSGVALPDPFAPPDTGGPQQEIKYEDLSPEDQAVMDRGRDVSNWIPVHDAFRAASLQRSREAAAETAARSLGLPDPVAGVEQ